MELAGVTKVSNQGQITLPINVRQDLNLTNHKVYVYETQDSVLISQKLFAPIEPGEAEYLAEEEQQKQLDNRLKSEGEEFV